jgi:hypothetical protein
MPERSAISRQPSAHRKSKPAGSPSPRRKKSGLLSRHHVVGAGFYLLARSGLNLFHRRRPRLKSGLSEPYGASRPPAERNLKPGDGGLARGHLQQHKGHWRRGCEYLGVDWPWPQDTYDYDKAEAIAIANWRRDGWPRFEMFMAEQFARRFRLPNAPYRACNDEYWWKVALELKKQKTELATENTEVQR